MDFNASLRRAIKTGEVLLGQNMTAQSIDNGSAQMVVVAGNCPENFRESSNTKNIVGIQRLLGKKDLPVLKPIHKFLFVSVNIDAQ